MMDEHTTTLQLALDAHHVVLQKALLMVAGQPADTRTQDAVVKTLRVIDGAITRNRSALETVMANLRFYVAFPEERHVDSGDIEMTVHGVGMSKEEAIRHAQGSYPDLDFMASRCTWRLYDYVQRHGIDDDFQWSMNDDFLVDIRETE